MNHFFIAIIALLPIVACANEAVWSSGGILKLERPALEFNARAVTPNWGKNITGSGRAFADSKGALPFQLVVDAEHTIHGKGTVVDAGQGALRVTYQLTPVKDVALSGLFVDFKLDAQALAKGSWSVGSKHGIFNETYTEMALFSGVISTLTLTFPAPSADKLVLTFDQPTHLLIQDDRKWSKTVTFRMGSAGGRTYTPNTACTVAFKLEAQEPIRLDCTRPIVLKADKDWSPLTYSKEILPGSALDFSTLGFIDAPAGKYGWLRVSEQGHFEFEKRPGKPQRFYGVNFCGTANYPTHAESDMLTARLVRLGYNSVRIHHYDNGSVQGSRDGLTLNPDQMERLDYLLATCYARGLYITTDLFVSRTTTWKQIGIDRTDAMDKNIFKFLCAVHEPAFQNWQAYARGFLNHTNQYTGRRYADEPGMPLLAMINEGTFSFAHAQHRDLQPVKTAWANWLKEKKAHDPAYADLREDEVPASFNGKAGAALALFIADMEGHMVARMKHFLRDEIKSRALITSQNCGPHYLPMQQVRESLYDYVDDHFYVDHPHFLEKKWQLPSRCQNANPIKVGNTAPNNVAFLRMCNKPLTITEYNYSAPGMFRGVGGILTGAMAAMQDWDGLWRFAYAHAIENIYDNKGSMSYFDISTDPLAQATERASLCLFMRGDLAATKKKVTLLFPEREITQLGEAAQRVSPAWSWAAWNVRIGNRVATRPATDETALSIREAFDKDKTDAFMAYTNQPTALVMNREQGSFTVVTERTCGGFAESGTIHAGPLTASIVETPATIWVSALDARPIASSKRLLLSHLTDVQCTGVTFAERSRQTLLEKGKLPYLVRNGSATISLTLAQAKAYTVYALATSGARLDKVPATAEGNTLRFTASVCGSQGACLTYEIVTE